jgi:hypothetical protein
MGLAEERTAKVRAINNKNKARARAMETRVMKRLGGTRVPMSGSGQMKGDGIVNGPLGMYLVECKCSAMQDRDGNGVLRFDYRWVTKLAAEVKAMRAVFGIFVLHHHQVSGDTVVMTEALYQRLTMLGVTGKSGCAISQPFLANGYVHSIPFCIHVTRPEVGKLMVMPLEQYEALLAQHEVQE